MRFGLACCLSVLLAWTPLAADDHDDLRQALALQKTMRQTIARVEPAVACVLVSRSDAYQRLGYAPDKAQPGKLGGFDPELVDAGPGPSDKDRHALRRKLDLADPRHVPQAFGSGVVLDAKGLILTNYHVVQDATKVYVRLSGGKASYADVHAADPRSDLAVLRVLDPKILPLTPIELGDADTIERGHFVLSIANPFAAGFRDGQPSASWGILSNVRRRAAVNPRDEAFVKPLHHHGTLLQTDARLHLGCSGGALVNLQGELIGLTTALAAIHGSETPGGFALPINAEMRRILDVLQRGEEVEYGFLGVSFSDRTPDGQPGVALAYATPGSPAKLEGKLRERDVILSINGVPLRQSDDLLAALGTQLAGSKVRLQVRRPGTREPFHTEVTLAKLHVPGKRVASSLGSRPFFRGLRVDHTSLLAQTPPRQPIIPAGVLVSEVQPDSPADRAFLKSGDVVTHVNNLPVASPAAFYRAVADVRGAVELTMYNFSNQEPPSRVILRQ